MVEADRSGEQSKEYGINRKSILNDLKYFDMCNGSLIPDVMHNVLEGTLQYEAKLMLNYMIFTEEYFTIDHLNSRIANLELGHMEVKDRPSLISGNTLRTSGHSLKQKGTLYTYGNAMQCMCTHNFELFVCSTIVHKV